MSRTEQIQKLLKTLSNNTPDLEGAALIDNDGLMISSAMGADLDEDSVAAMSAALLGIAERIVGELNRGTFEMVMLKGDDGYVVMTRCGPDAVLACLTASKAKLGLVFLDLSRTARELQRLLG